MQAAYEEFGCNDGNVHFMGIDKGNTNEDVILFDSLYGIHYPSVSGQNGGGNVIHQQYDIQGTPSIVVITPDKLIAVHQIYPPSTANVVDKVTTAGGIPQSCVTDISPQFDPEELMSIGPNPARDYAYINLNLEQRTYLDLSIFDLTGKEVLSINSKYYETGSHKVPVDLSGFPEGFYFVQLRSQNNIIATKKLIRVK